MINMIKDKVMEKAMSLVQSPAVNKFFENDKVGVAIEKALLLPIKISSLVETGKERMISLMDLATQEDLDKLRRSMSKVEEILEEIKAKSGALIDKMESSKKGTL